MISEPITLTTVVDTFLLLPIGIGPKLALVPYFKATAGMPLATKRLVLKKMLTTAATVAAVLLVPGGAMTRLLHISTGALSVASGIILLIIAIRMVLGEDTSSRITCLLPKWCPASCSRPSLSSLRSTGLPIFA